MAPSASISDIVTEYAGKWLLVHVIEYDSSGWPVQGMVIESSSSRKRVSEALLAKLADQTLPRPYCLFKAIPLHKTVGEWRQTLTRPGIETVNA